VGDLRQLNYAACFQSVTVTSQNRGRSGGQDWMEINAERLLTPPTSYGYGQVSEGPEPGPALALFAASIMLRQHTPLHVPSIVIKLVNFVHDDVKFFQMFTQRTVLCVCVVYFY